MSADELPLFTLWEATLGDLLDRTARFPKAVRFTFAQRIDTLALDVLERIVEARYSRQKVVPLKAAGLSVEKVRILCRIAHNRGFLDHKSFEHLARRLDEAGRMVGGWLRSREES
jgi:hypothetical protein